MPHRAHTIAARITGSSVAGAALALSAGAAIVLSLTACPSKSTPDPNSAASGQTTASTAPPATSSGGPSAQAGGPLAALNPSDAKQETWQLESGPVPFLNWDAQHLRISASCKKPTGQLDCQALQAARGGPTVELTQQDRARMVPPGALVCKKLHNQLTTGRDPGGNEDGFCVFPDGSMISQGSLAQYALKQ